MLDALDVTARRGENKRGDGGGEGDNNDETTNMTDGGTKATKTDQRRVVVNINQQQPL